MSGRTSIRAAQRKPNSIRRLRHHVESLPARSAPPEKQRNCPKNGYREHGRWKPERQANKAKIDIGSASKMVGLPLKCVSRQIAVPSYCVALMNKMRLHAGIRCSNVCRVVKLICSREPIGEQFPALDFHSAASPDAGGFVLPSRPAEGVFPVGRCNPGDERCRAKKQREDRATHE